MPRKTKEEAKEIKKIEKAKKETKKIEAKLELENKKKTKTKKTKRNSSKKESLKTKKASIKTKSLKNTIIEEKKEKLKKPKETNKKEFLTEYYDLPFKYNKTVIKLLAQTPETLFVYWEISDKDIENYKEKYGENFFETSIPILKIHNKTMNYTFEIEINDFANCWYIHVNDSKCEYEVELDRKQYIQNEDSQYIYISTSNNLISPNDHVLLENLPSYVTFKNVKTLSQRKIKVPKKLNKVFGIKEIYNIFYKDNEFINNPSSKF